MKVSIGHPTGRPNFTVVEVGNLTLWFSYQTVVGFCDNDSDNPTIHASENVWGPTTGKHLNHFSDASEREPREAFLQALESALAKR